VHPHRLGDDVADFHARIERAVGVLEDHLDAPAQRAQFLGPQAREVVAVVDDFAGSRPLEQQDAAAGGGLAAAALADKSEGLATPQGEIDAVDRLDLADEAMGDNAFGDREMLVQPLHFEEG